MSHRRLTVRDIAESTGVAFGTSGVRGLVSNLSDAVCYAYTAGFLRYLDDLGGLTGTDRRVALAGDLRPSTVRILGAVARAAVDNGYRPLNFGRIPSPALALYGFQHGIPTIMVTGSHIPDDRNGIKFTTRAGELRKEDEAGMLAQSVTMPDDLTADGGLLNPVDMGPVDPTALHAYLARWLAVFPPDYLRGLRLVVYQHSAVGRDFLPQLLERLGAGVMRLGHSDTFLPVDTEAIRDEDRTLAHVWARVYAPDAIISTDGDSDRPLLADEMGDWLRGDITGILCARFFGAEVVVTPVSSNTAVERCGWFTEVRRTRIGSPYVLEAMRQAAEGAACVVGYEANGGFLTATPVRVGDAVLAPLPTRDAIIVHLALLGLCRQQGVPLSRLTALLPPRRTASGRVQQINLPAMRAWLAGLTQEDSTALRTQFPWLAPIVARDLTDGLRLHCEDGDIVHFRLSGNAPELRCYTESTTKPRAEALLHRVLTTIRQRLAGR